MKGLIYKINNSKNNKVYIDITFDTIKRAFSRHKNNVIDGSNKSIHKLIKDIGVKYFSIVLLEEIELNDRKELLKLRDNYIKNCDNCLNITIDDEKIGRIYKINNSKNKKVFIDATFATIGRVFSRHKYQAMHASQIPIHKLIRDIGVEYFSISSIESKEFANRKELMKLRDNYIENHNDLCINKYTSEEKKIGRIYKINNSKNDKVYIGSTFETLDNRFYKHKSKKKLRPNELLYELINEIGEQYFSIILLEEIEVGNKKQLLKLEDKYINEFRGQHPELCLNKNNPAPTIEMKKATKKIYYFKHRDKTYKARRACITKNKESHEKYKTYMREYGKNRSRTLCECGVNVTDNKSSIRDHNKTNKHIKKINLFYLNLLPNI